MRAIAQSGCAGNLPPFLDVSTLQSQSGLFHASLRSYPPLRGTLGISRGVGSAPRRRAISDGRAASESKLRARGRPGVLASAPQPRLGPLSSIRSADLKNSHAKSTGHGSK